MKIRKMTAFLLAVLTVASLLTLPISAAYLTVYTTVSESEAVRRLNEFMSSDASKPGTYWYGTFAGGSTCFGYAKWCVYYVFGAADAYSYRGLTYSGYNARGMDVIAHYDTLSADNMKALCAQAHPGDIIQFNVPRQHTMIFISATGSDFTVLHSNYEASYKTTKNTYTYGHFSSRNSSGVSLVRASNYKPDSNGTVFNLYQTATVTARSGLMIRESADINSRTVGALAHGTSVNVTGYPLRDSSGYTWRRLLDGRGYVCETYLNVTGGNIMAQGTFRIRSATGSYLTYFGNPANDTNIVAYRDLKGTSSAVLQEWVLTPLAYYSDTGSLVYRIAPAANDAYSMDCDSADRYNFHLWDKYVDSMHQRWLIEVNKDGSIAIYNDGTRLSVDIEGGAASPADGTDIICWEYHGGTNQTWYLVQP